MPRTKNEVVSQSPANRPVAAFEIFAANDTDVGMFPEFFPALRSGTAPVDIAARPRCPDCRHPFDYQQINAEFRHRGHLPDFTETLDGYTLVSPRLARFLQSSSPEGIRLVPLGPEGTLLCLFADRQLRIDSRRQKTVFGPFCGTCRRHTEVSRPGPTVLLDLREPVKSGIYRSDLIYGDWHGLSPMLIVGLETAVKLQAAKFSGVALEPVLQWWDVDDDDELSVPPPPIPSDVSLPE